MEYLARAQIKRQKLLTEADEILLQYKAEGAKRTRDTNYK